MAKFCPHCGKPVKEGSKFCSSCGQAIVTDDHLINGNQQESKNKQQNRNKKIIGGAIISLAIIIAIGGGIYYHQHEKTVDDGGPAVTETTNQGEKANKSENVEDKATGKSTLHTVGKILDAHNIGGKVLASSDEDDSGFLAVVKFEDGYNFAAYDKKNNRVALIPYETKENRNLLHMLKQSRRFSNGKISYDPILFDMYFNDADPNGPDADKGIWQRSTHMIPIYAMFTVENDEVIPGMLYSGSGNRPSHYHSVLKDVKTVDAANVVLTHVKGLITDMQKRNVNL